MACHKSHHHFSPVTPMITSIALTTPCWISSMINWQRTFLRSLREITLFAQLLHPVVISIGYSFVSQTLLTQLLFTINRFILYNPLINNKTIIITLPPPRVMIHVQGSGSWCIHSRSKQCNNYTHAICYWKRNKSAINPRRDSVAVFQINFRDFPKSLGRQMKTH